MIAAYFKAALLGLAIIAFWAALDWASMKLGMPAPTRSYWDTFWGALCAGGAVLTYWNDTQTP